MFVYMCVLAIIFNFSKLFNVPPDISLSLQVFFSPFEFVMQSYVVLVTYQSKMICGAREIK